MQYRSSWMTEELGRVSRPVPEIPRQGSGAACREMARQKIVDRAAWRALGEIGALLPSVPEAYGGQGATFAYDAAVIEDIETVVPELATGYCVHSRSSPITSSITAPRSRSSAGCQSSRAANGSVPSR